MSWTQLSFVLPAQSVESVEAVLFALGALSVANRDAGSDAWYVDATPETSPWEEVRLEALFAPAVEREAIRAALQATAGAEAMASLAFETLEDRDWAREWMRDWKPQRFGRRLWICPTWMEPPDRQAATVFLDPGNAFGTGTHASTALCLEWLAAHDLAGRTVLDYGCGSGILAIAALCLGAERAWACDLDAQALAVCAENAARNAVADRLWIGSPSELPECSADVLLANILSRTLVDLAAELGQRLRPGGALALAGILETQVEAVIAAYAPWCRLAPAATREEWVLLTGEREVEGARSDGAAADRPSGRLPRPYS
ncbi:MAG TPA: 50S ribosomal protein L11 methyltransferase [Candidatus Krumholzibacteria bacterium]|nr:50S ribosomal protein L11 methyltransferase [Candidatus Krumholzibacteria bacterium]